MAVNTFTGPLARRLPAIPSTGTVVAFAVRNADALTALAVALAAFVVYERTLTPSLSYISPDGNELATVAATLGLAHPTGYPLYTWLGWLSTVVVPVGDAAHRVNLLSAAGAAGACGLLVLILRDLRTPLPAAAFAGLVLAYSPTLWSQATISEVYAPNLFFVALEVYLLLHWGRLQRDEAVRRSGSPRSTLLFSAWALTFGLSTGTHLSGLGFAPAFALYILLVNWRVLLQPLVLAPGVVALLLGLLQFLWIPVRSAMGEPSPDPISPTTLDGFLSYTVNAFPQFKWAFPLEVMPDRFIVYGRFVVENVGRPGVVAAVAGAAGMAVLRPRTFLLFGLMLTAHVIFFMSYRAQDLEVFFIPSHFVLVVAIGFAAGVAYRAALRAATAINVSGGPAAIVAGGVVASLTVVQLTRSYAANDQSAHTEINDFYVNAFALLPAGATLQGTGGVFGYDLLYYPEVYDLRPDVTVPSGRFSGGSRQQPPVPSTGSTYTVTPAGFGFETRASIGGAWAVPVLVAPAHTTSSAFIRRDLVLYELQPQAPTLVLTNAEPAIPADVPLGAVRYLGADVARTTVERGERVHLRLYWRLDAGGGRSVTLGLGDQTEVVARFTPGFGLVERLAGQSTIGPGTTFADEFDFVVLSSAPKGSQPLVLRGTNGASVTIATLTVE